MDPPKPCRTTNARLCRPPRQSRSPDQAATGGTARSSRLVATHSPTPLAGRFRSRGSICSRPAADLWGRTQMKPETVGMSSARLARLDQVMKHRYVDGGYLPGMLVHVYRKGQLVHTGICGQIDIERGKPITAVALMMLVEEGLIGLDDVVHSHIPSWKNLGVYASGMASLLPDTPPSFLTTPTLRPMKVVD